MVFLNELTRFLLDMAFINSPAIKTPKDTKDGINILARLSDIPQTVAGVVRDWEMVSKWLFRFENKTPIESKLVESMILS